MAFIATHVDAVHAFYFFSIHTLRGIRTYTYTTHEANAVDRGLLSNDTTAITAAIQFNRICTADLLKPSWQLIIGECSDTNNQHTQNFLSELSKLIFRTCNSDFQLNTSQ